MATIKASAKVCGLAAAFVLLLVGIAKADPANPALDQDINLKTASGHTGETLDERGENATNKGDLGRELFIVKGCIACHAIHEIGGDQAAPLDIHTLGDNLTPFDLAARMWNKAMRMSAAQRMLFGHTIEMTGRELEHLAAFLTDHTAQHQLTKEDVRSAMAGAQNERARAGIPRSRW